MNTTSISPTVLRLTSSEVMVARRDTMNTLATERYPQPSGHTMSTALQKVSDSSSLLQSATSMSVLIDSPILMVPTAEFQEPDIETLYHHAISDHTADPVLFHEMSGLQATALFAVEREVKSFLDHRFSGIDYQPLCMSLWQQLSRHSQDHMRQYLNAYFHDHRMEVAVFHQGRFKFYNAFDTAKAQDALYFLLYVWKQLALHVENDDLRLLGTVPDTSWLIPQLRRYLRHVDIIEAQSEPSDLLAFFHQPVIKS